VKNLDVDKLIAVIQGIPGQKIVTLYAPTSLNPEFSIDIQSAGRMGYEEGHEALFKAKLVHALIDGGGLVVRQLLGVKVQRRMPNGKVLWIPKKNLYGFKLGGGGFQPLSREEMRRAHCTDHKTGKVLEPEPDVIFSTIGD
jgi:hypothetical protein